METCRLASDIIVVNTRNPIRLFVSGIGLGLNTGGTYTDAVLVDLSTNEVIQKNKFLTTHEDLSVGIDGAISKLDRESLKKLSMVSLSSTLATNFVVEGKGRRIGLIAVGSKFDGSIHVDRYISIKGGHDVHGKQTDALEEKVAVEFMNSIKGSVDALAITSFMSVYNPVHEKRLKTLAEKILGIPVVCGHELSSDLGFSERAVTSIMNANLLPAIKELIMSVRAVFSKYGITAPLMIVKGDGSLMSEDMALEKPVETIISGPAASIIGARALSGIDDAIVIDMGGTTTDIGILKNGVPLISEDGATIAGKNTKVLAAKIFTAGLGGDSRVLIVGGNTYLSDRRVVPLCIAATKYPGLKDKLRTIAELNKRQYFELMGASDTVQDIEFFEKLTDPADGTITGRDKGMLELLNDGPMNLKDIADKLGTHPMAIDTREMEDRGIIQRIGLTPTDILHAEGTYTEYDVDASKYGVTYMSRRVKMTDDQFIAFVKQRVIDKLAVFLIKKVLGDEIGTSEMDEAGKEFMKRFITGVPNENFGCDFKMTKPIIGIGAPAGAYIPQATAKLHTEFILPKEWDVGNAVGAITGRVVETVLMTVRPARFFSNEDDPKSSVQSSFGSWEFGNLRAALDFAEVKGKEIAKQHAMENGADDVELFVEKNEDKYRRGNGEELVKIEIKVTALGRPKFVNQ